jgi:hypothetical protein
VAAMLGGKMLLSWELKSSLNLRVISCVRIRKPQMSRKSSK